MADLTAPQPTDPDEDKRAAEAQLTLAIEDAHPDLPIRIAAAIAVRLYEAGYRLTEAGA